MAYTIIIPARLKSTRLPNKMLLPIHDKPVIEWTWMSAQKSKATRIIIATDDNAIGKHMKRLGAEVVMTQASHETGTDRLSEVALKEHLGDQEIIVNWQGDEPFLPANLADKVADTLKGNPQAQMSTLATRIATWEEFNDPNAVKVILNERREALYFSRAPIPYPRGEMEQEGEVPEAYNFLRHIGVYGYRGCFLKNYPTLPPSPLEEIEKLEQLRALANGSIISVARIEETPPTGIDTEIDLERATDWLTDKIANALDEIESE